MSTPIETNTEELQEVLQQVYNLPNRSGGGGSADPDLAIETDYGFDFIMPNDNADYNISKISFSANEVISACQKLLAGKAIRVTLTGLINMNSYCPDFMTTYQAVRVMAYGSEHASHLGNKKCLVVRFEVPTMYYFLSGDGYHAQLEYRFEIDPDAGTVILDNCALWDFS